MKTVNIIFSSLTTDFEMFETRELLNWYLHGCNCYAKIAKRFNSGEIRRIFFLQKLLG